MQIEDRLEQIFEKGIEISRESEIFYSEMHLLAIYPDGGKEYVIDGYRQISPRSEEHDRMLKILHEEGLNEDLYKTCKIVTQVHMLETSEKEIYRFTLPHSKYLIEDKSRKKELEIFVGRKIIPGGSPIRRGDISTRAWNGLLINGIGTFEELAQLTEKDLLCMQHIGKRTVQEFKDLLEDKTLSLSD
jgi:hypothetical protein